MKIPEDASFPFKTTFKEDSEEIVRNPFSNKEYLTRHEAIDCINHLSGILLADGYHKRQEKYPRHSQQKDPTALHVEP